VEGGHRSKKERDVSLESVEDLLENKRAGDLMSSKAEVSHGRTWRGHRLLAQTPHATGFPSVSL